MAGLHCGTLALNDRPIEAAALTNDSFRPKVVGLGGMELVGSLLPGWSFLEGGVPCDRWDDLGDV